MAWVIPVVLGIVLAAALLFAHRQTPGRSREVANSILGAVGMGVLLAAVVAALYNAACDDLLVGYPLCLGADKGAPWFLFTGATAAPSAMLTWYWRAVKRNEELVTGRFGQALELLAKEETAVGAVFLLEKLATDAPGYHQPVLQTLAVFVRKERIRNEGEDPIPWSHAAPEAFRCIGRLQRVEGSASVVDLMMCDLHGVRAPGAHLEGADLEEADLEGAYLEEAHLEGADLEGADLEGADLERAHLESANLRGTNLAEANLQGAHLQAANLQAANLEGANLVGADLQRADLVGADLQRAGLQAANLEGAYLDEASLEGAYLDEANLQGAHLQAANLQRADLRGANLDAANIRGADLQGARRNASDPPIPGWTLASDDKLAHDVEGSP